MEHAPPGHGSPGARTSGMVMDPRSNHRLFAAIFYGGRRRRLYTRLTAVSGAGPGDRVLDIGCGTGDLTRAMAEAVAPGGTAHGVDPSREAIAQARQLTRLPNCTFSDGIAEALDAPDGSYDVVVTSLMVHHLPETLRPRAMGEVLRVLRPGGSVLVAEFRPPASRIGRRLFGTLTRHRTMADTSVDQLASLVQDAGFQQTGTADLPPWFHYVRATKPGQA